MALDWYPGAEIPLLRRRADLLMQIRTFFAQRQVWEVETPTLSRSATTDSTIESLCVPELINDATAFYLQTSPEFFMKRLLAAGSGSIYQIGKAYRADECSRLHNPEFTMLEWYRVGFDHHQLMDEVDDLLHLVLSNHCSLGPSERLTYQQLFEQYCGIEPHSAPVDQLAAYCSERGINLHTPSDLTHDDWLHVILSHHIEPKLGQRRLTFIYDYPPSQASLAKIRSGQPAVAERFEVYYNGIELGNGFHELLDAHEQRQRFEHDLQRRNENRQPSVPKDERFLAALEAGMPSCAGVALGVDRLVMSVLGADSLDQVMAFAHPRV